MILSAEYADKMACPFCSSPARKLGEWEVRDGEWLFTPRPVIVREWFGDERPTKNSEKWQPVNESYTTTDREGVTISKERKKWCIVATHLCTSFLTDEECSRELLTGFDLVPYLGTEHEAWMSAPTRAGAVDVSAVVAKVKA